MDDILKTFRISGAGMRAQGTRLRVISRLFRLQQPSLACLFRMAKRGFLMDRRRDSGNSHRAFSQTADI